LLAALFAQFTPVQLPRIPRQRSISRRLFDQSR